MSVPVRHSSPSHGRHWLFVTPRWQPHHHLILDLSFLQKKPPPVGFHSAPPHPLQPLTCLPPCGSDCSGRFLSEESHTQTCVWLLPLGVFLAWGGVGWACSQGGFVFSVGSCSGGVGGACSQGGASSGGVLSASMSLHGWASLSRQQVGVWVFSASQLRWARRLTRWLCLRRSQAWTGVGGLPSRRPQQPPLSPPAPLRACPAALPGGRRCLLWSEVLFPPDPRVCQGMGCRLPQGQGPLLCGKLRGCPLGCLKSFPD